MAYLAYHRDIMHFTDHPDPDRDNAGNLVDLGVEGDLAEKVTGKADVGYVDRLYAVAPAPGISKETRDVTALADVVYSPLERPKIDLKFSRTLEESAFDINELYIATGGILTLSHKLPWGLLVQIYVGYADQITSLSLKATF